MNDSITPSESARLRHRASTDDSELNRQIKQIDQMCDYYDRKKMHQQYIKMKKLFPKSHRQAAEQPVKPKVNQSENSHVYFAISRVGEERSPREDAASQQGYSKKREQKRADKQFEKGEFENDQAGQYSNYEVRPSSSPPAHGVLADKKAKLRINPYARIPAQAAKNGRLSNRQRYKQLHHCPFTDHCNGVKFTSRNSLEQHIFRHQNPYRCQFCLREIGRLAKRHGFELPEALGGTGKGESVDKVLAKVKGLSESIREQLHEGLTGFIYQLDYRRHARIIHGRTNIHIDLILLGKTHGPDAEELMSVGEESQSWKPECKRTRQQTQMQSREDSDSPAPSRRRDSPRRSSEKRRGSTRPKPSGLLGFDSKSISKQQSAKKPKEEERKEKLFYHHSVSGKDSSSSFDYIDGFSSHRGNLCSQDSSSVGLRNLEIGSNEGMVSNEGGKLTKYSPRVPPYKLTCSGAKRQNLILSYSKHDSRASKTSGQKKKESMTCHHCNKAFRSFIGFEQHMKKHENPYRCDQCGKEFFKKTYLNMHQRLQNCARVSQDHQEAEALQKIAVVGGKKLALLRIGSPNDDSSEKFEHGSCKEECQSYRSVPKEEFAQEAQDAAPASSEIQNAPKDKAVVKILFATQEVQKEEQIDSKQLVESAPSQENEEEEAKVEANEADEADDAGDDSNSISHQAVGDCQDSVPATPMSKERSGGYDSAGQDSMNFIQTPAPSPRIVFKKEVEGVPAPLTQSEVFEALAIIQRDFEHLTTVDFSASNQACVHEWMTSNLNNLAKVAFGTTKADKKEYNECDIESLLIGLKQTVTSTGQSQDEGFKSIGWFQQAVWLVFEGLKNC